MRRAVIAIAAFALGALLSATAAEAAQPAPVAAALVILKQGGAALANSWRYRETITSAKGSEQLSYDPTRPAGARWKVLRVNGKPPSAAARKRLVSQAARAAKRAGKGLRPGSGWLARSRFQLVKTTAGKLIYDLHPKPAASTTAGAANLLTHLAGQFVVARGDHRPLSLRLDNFESFSPRFGVKIESFAFRARFKRLDKGGGPVVVVRTSNSASGKVFWIKGFKDKTKVVLSGFTPVAASAPAAQTGG
jgi:hypothetical protein